jgi:hypothetical protein
MRKSISSERTFGATSDSTVLFQKLGTKHALLLTKIFNYCSGSASLVLSSSFFLHFTFLLFDVADIAETLSSDMQKENLWGRNLTLKLKTFSFEVPFCHVSSIHNMICLPLPSHPPFCLPLYLSVSTKGRYKGANTMAELRPNDTIPV